MDRVADVKLLSPRAAEFLAKLSGDTGDQSLCWIDDDHTSVTDALSAWYCGTEGARCAPCLFLNVPVCIGAKRSGGLLFHGSCASVPMHEAFPWLVSPALRAGVKSGRAFTDAKWFDQITKEAQAATVINDRLLEAKGLTIVIHGWGWMDSAAWRLLISFILKHRGSMEDMRFVCTHVHHWSPCSFPWDETVPVVQCPDILSMFGAVLQPTDTRVAALEALAPAAILPDSCRVVLGVRALQELELEDPPFPVLGGFRCEMPDIRHFMQREADSLFMLVSAQCSSGMYGYPLGSRVMLTDIVPGLAGTVVGVRPPSQFVVQAATARFGDRGEYVASPYLLYHERLDDFGYVDVEVQPGDTLRLRPVLWRSDMHRTLQGVGSVSRALLRSYAWALAVPLVSLTHAQLTGSLAHHRLTVRGTWAHIVVPYSEESSKSWLARVRGAGKEVSYVLASEPRTNTADVQNMRRAASNAAPALSMKKLRTAFLQCVRAERITGEPAGKQDEEFEWRCGETSEDVVRDGWQDDTGGAESRLAQAAAAAAVALNGGAATEPEDDNITLVKPRRRRVM